MTPAFSRLLPNLAVGILLMVAPEPGAAQDAGFRSTPSPRTCPAKPAALVDEAAIQLDGDWTEVFVPRCSGASPGVDELRMLYFEDPWRFFYTDLFDGSSAHDGS